MVGNPNLPEEYYGKWWEIIDNEYPGYFDQIQPDDTIIPVRQQSTTTRFAESSKNPTHLCHDPRINRYTQQQNESIQQTQKPADGNLSNNPNLDRHNEMSRLLANSLTRKYFANMKEQAEMEQGMSKTKTTDNQNAQTKQ